MNHLSTGFSYRCAYLRDKPFGVWEDILLIADQETRFADAPVPNYNTFDAVHGNWVCRDSAHCCSIPTSANVQYSKEKGRDSNTL